MVVFVNVFNNFNITLYLINDITSEQALKDTGYRFRETVLALGGGKDPLEVRCFIWIVNTLMSWLQFILD